jgi:hypothetical protein
MRLTHPTGVVFGIAIASTAAAAQPPARGHAGPPRREIVYLTPDINGGSGPTEIRRVEIREVGPSEQIEEATIRRPDLNGTWSVTERMVTRRLEGAGREQSIIDIYDRDADGFVRSDGRLDLSQRQSCMVEKDPTRGGQLDATSAAEQQLRADLVLQVPDLPTEGRLRCVEPPLGSHGEAPLLGDSDEIPKMPQLHSVSHACEVWSQLTKYW